jgi:hypothetical protein
MLTIDAQMRGTILILYADYQLLQCFILPLRPQLLLLRLLKISYYLASKHHRTFRLTPYGPSGQAVALLDLNRTLGPSFPRAARVAASG